MASQDYIAAALTRLIKKTQAHCIVLTQSKPTLVKLPTEDLEEALSKTYLIQGHEFRLLPIGIQTEEFILPVGYFGKHELAVGETWLRLQGDNTGASEFN
jgi:hypothetical protein